jgi:predicted secreted protein
MANTRAFSGVGTMFQRLDPVSSTYASIAEVNSITGPTMTRGTIDVTSLDSDSGYRESISGFRDAGTVTLAMNFTAEGYASLKEDFESPDLNWYRIVLSNPEVTTIEFQGLVNELPVDIKPDDKVTATCTIKITGAVILGSGT